MNHISNAIIKTHFDQLKNFILPILLFVNICAFGQEENSLLFQTETFSFHSNYWINLNQFFFKEATLQMTGNGSLISDETWSEMGEFEMKRIQKTVSFYKDSIVGKKQNEQYLHDFETWLSNQNQRSLYNIPGMYKWPCMMLIQSSLTFRNYFWDDQQQAIRSFISSKTQQFNQNASEILAQTFDLTGIALDSAHYRVDVSYAGYIRQMTNNNIHLYVTDFENGEWLATFFHNLLLAQKQDNSKVANTLSELTTELPADLHADINAYIISKVVNSAFAVKESTSPPISHTEYLSTFDKYLPKYISGRKDLNWACKKVLWRLKD